MGTEAIRKRAATAASALCLAASAVAQDQPVVVEGPVSEAIYVNERHKEGNDQYGFAGAHRAGDMLYVSGVVVGSRQGEVLDDCLQLHGGYGYMQEYDIAEMWADARVQRIYGGTNEIMKELIARAL